MYIPEYTRNYPQISQNCPKYPNISQKISQNCSMNVASCASTKVQELAQRLDERLRATPGAHGGAKSRSGFNAKARVMC